MGENVLKGVGKTLRILLSIKVFRTLFWESGGMKNIPQ